MHGMDWRKALGASLTEELNMALAALTDEEADAATELRVRVDGARLCGRHGARKLCGMDASGMRLLIERMTRGRMHALGECVRQGYLPLEGGFRAGVCGRAIVRDGQVEGLEDIGGICVRIARDVPGAADGIMAHMLCGSRVRSALVVSAPGLGKTTLLRDAARQLIGQGMNIAIADERGELNGIAGADVLSMCPKAQALAMLTRTMRPDAIVTDELGAPGDAQAAADAVRCGAAVIASAHAGTPAHAAQRPGLGETVRNGLFERIISIGGPQPGQNITVYDERGKRLC
jgi:stage III sporulation protein AA